MHDGMPHDPIQVQGHETFKVRNSSIFKIYLPHDPIQGQGLDLVNVCCCSYDFCTAPMAANVIGAL